MSRSSSAHQALALENTIKISSSSSSARISPLQDIGLSQGSPPHTVLRLSHPVTTSMMLQVICPPGRGASTAALSGTWPPLENSSTPSVVGSAADVTGPLPFQSANRFGYVDNLCSSTDFSVPDLIRQRNAKHSPLHSTLSDLKFVDQSHCEWPRLGTVGHCTQDALVEDLGLQTLW